MAPLVAGIQAAEVVKVILDQGNTLQGKVLFINLLDADIIEAAL